MLPCWLHPPSLPSGCTSNGTVTSLNVPPARSTRSSATGKWGEEGDLNREEETHPSYNHGSLHPQLMYTCLNNTQPLVRDPLTHVMRVWEWDYISGLGMRLFLVWECNYISGLGMRLHFWFRNETTFLVSERDYFSGLGMRQKSVLIEGSCNLYVAHPYTGIYV